MTDHQIRFPADWPETAESYGPTGRPATHEGYRGDYYLRHQPNQIRRDITGEDFQRMPQPRKVLRVTILTDPARIKELHDYKYLVTIGAQSQAAFRTKQGLRNYMAAYGMTFHRSPRSAGSGIGCGTLTIGDPSTWQPLNCRPIRPANHRDRYHYWE